MIIHIDPSLIKFHSLVRDMPRWEDDSQEMQSLVADVKVRGIDQALIVTKTDRGVEAPGYYFLIDGRHRLIGGRFAELKKVPVIVRDEKDAVDVILGSLVHRRHFTSKGALAYLSYPVIADAVEKNKSKRAGNFRKTELPPVRLTAEEMCERLGFGHDLYLQAKQVHEIFDKDPGYKELKEQHVLSGESGLGAVIAGFAGRASTAGKAKPDSNYLCLAENGKLTGLMPKALISLRNGFKSWSKLDFAARGKLKEEWETLLESLPEDLR